MHSHMNKLFIFFLLFFRQKRYVNKIIELKAAINFFHNNTRFKQPSPLNYISNPYPIKYISSAFTLSPHTFPFYSSAFPVKAKHYHFFSFGFTSANKKY